MDVGPNFGAPGFVVNGHFSTGGTAGVEFSALPHAVFGLKRGDGFLGASQLNEDATHFRYFIIGINEMFVAQEITKAELSGLGFRLGASVKGAVFGAELLDRVAGHPKGFFTCHSASNF
jgi:hypothetical protein